MKQDGNAGHPPRAGLVALLVVMLAMVPALQAAAGAPADWRVQDATRQADGTALVRRSQVGPDGGRLGYTIRAGLIPLRLHDTGEVVAEIFFTAYSLENPADPGRRPITFQWRGGPGAPAAIPSMGGPLRVARGSDRLEPNPDTWLHKTDMVFIDPVGTGYSRMTDPAHADLFFNAVGDAESVAEFIRIYLRRYAPGLRRPMFLSGGSYGSLRAPLVAAAATRRGMPVAGLILAAQVLSSGAGADLEQTFLIPTFTATAHAHSKLSPELQADLEVAVQASEQWASEEYLTALGQGNRLDPERRRAVARRMAELTGLDAAFIEARDLRVSAQEFASELLRADGRQVGMYDSRISQPLQRGDWDPRTDASLMAGGQALAGAAEARLVIELLGIRTDRLYANPFGGHWPGPEFPFDDWMASRWFGRAAFDEPVHGGGSASMRSLSVGLPTLVDLIKRTRGKTRTLIVGGLYDLTTPYFGAEYVASRAPAEYADSIRTARYPMGHTAEGPEFTRGALEFIDQVLGAQP